MRLALFDYGAGNLHSLGKALAVPGVDVIVEDDARRLTSADAVVLPGVGAFAVAAARLAPGRLALARALRDGMPGLGICLGMQLLFEGSDEAEAPSPAELRREDVVGDAMVMADRAREGIVHTGGAPRRDGATLARTVARGTMPGDATEPVIDEPEPATRGLALIPGRVTRLHARQVPQIGWNAVETPTGVRDPLLEAAGLDVAYFANSFACRPEDEAVVRAWSEHDDDRFPAMVRIHRTVGVQFHPEKSSAPGVRFVHAWLDEARRSAR